MRYLTFYILIIFIAGTLTAQTKVEEKFITSAANGDSAKVQKFIEKGVDVNIRNKSKWFALAYACKYGHFGTVKILIEKNADINQVVNTGSSPLMIALNNGKLDIAEYLIEKGANIDQKDLTGMSPLAWAAKRGDIETVKLLLGHGADVNSKNLSSRTVLDNAGAEEVKIFLKKNGAKSSKEQD